MNSKLKIVIVLFVGVIIGFIGSTIYLKKEIVEATKIAHEITQEVLVSGTELHAYRYRDKVFLLGDIFSDTEYMVKNNGLSKEYAIHIAKMLVEQIGNIEAENSHYSILSDIEKVRISKLKEDASFAIKWYR